MGLQITHAQTKFGLKEFITAGATIVASFGIFFALNAQVGAEAGTVVVTPTNQQGWYNADTRGTGGINFTDDSTSPYPTGALRLTTGDNNVDKAQYMKDTSMPLSQASDLSYSTKQVSGPATAAASYQIEVYLNGDDSGFTTLVYEPYWNGSVDPGVWQNWDVDAGRFWSSKTFSDEDCSVVNGFGGAPFYTLADLKSNCPEAIVTSYGVNVGSYNPNYNVETDGFKFNSTTFNFEQKEAAATNKEQCKNGGYLNFMADYKNQGQCVSSLASKNK